MTDFKERLAIIFEESGKLQPDFAESIGVSEKTYRSYRDGDTQPRVDVLANISKVYNVNCEWLILGEGPIYRDDTTQKKGRSLPNRPSNKKDATSPEFKEMAVQMKEMQKQISTLITTNQQLVDKLLNK